VNVQVVADEKSNAGRYSVVTFLANQGVPVRVNVNYAIFHHKFVVIDERHVETGSFNFSAAAANKNAENVLLLRNVPEIAEQYSQEWQRLWDEGTEVKPRY
jgi:phosphatidylserine/phosphatidylglycerophosphate/cardiolipin synthase-like enzyme